MRDLFRKYIEDFVNQPNAITSGMPLCPFALKAIDSAVFVPLSVENILSSLPKLVIAWSHTASLEEVERIAAIINATTDDYVAFPGHPLHEFKVGDIYTRRDPVPNVQVISKKELEQAEAALRNTEYYTNFVLNEKF